MYIPRFLRDLVRLEVEARLKDMDREQTRSVRIFTENGNVLGQVTMPANNAGRRRVY
jgi:hypothetical protein